MTKQRIFRRKYLATSSNHLDRPKRRKLIFYLLTPRLDTHSLVRINHILGVRLRIHERGAERKATVDNERVRYDGCVEEEIRFEN